MLRPLIFTLIFVSPGYAQNAPPPHMADPDVYTVVADGKSLRMTLNMLKPGQRDKFHSHKETAAYYISDCNVRVHTPDGRFVERNIKAGTASTGGAVSSHSIENIGQSECRVIVTEPK
jgi:mannose-6-phosphate isomerase-like protein (cupin superfamily)